MKASKLLTLVLSSVLLVGTSLACAEVGAHDKFEPNNKHSQVMPKKQHHMSGHKKAPKHSQFHAHKFDKKPLHMNGHKKAPNKHHQFRSQKFAKQAPHMNGHKKAPKHPQFRAHKFAKHPPVIHHHKLPKHHGKTYTRLHHGPRIVINL